MAYATLADLQRLLTETDLIRLTDDAECGAVDETVAGEALSSAQAEVDAMIGGRAKLPLERVPEILKRITAELAVEGLYSRRPTLALPETWRSRISAARKLLDRYAAGKIGLGLPEPPAAPDTYEQGVKTWSRPQIFGPGVMDKF